MFSHSPAQLQELVSYLLAEAKALGATDAAAELSEGSGLSVSVRKGNIETIEQNLDKQAGVTVFIGQRRGNAGTSDFSKESLKASVKAAFHIAQHTAEDDCAGLAEADLLEKNPKDLDLYHPWNINTAQAVEVARDAERGAFAVSKNITNSDGATVSAQQSHFMLGTSNGFMGGYAISRHYIACTQLLVQAIKKALPCSVMIGTQLLVHQKIWPGLKMLAHMPLKELWQDWVLDQFLQEIAQFYLKHHWPLAWWGLMCKPLRAELCTESLVSCRTV